MRPLLQEYCFFKPRLEGLSKGEAQGKVQETTPTNLSVTTLESVGAPTFQAQLDQNERVGT